MNKQKYNQNKFCLPKHQKKNNVNRQRFMTITEETNEKSTETTDIKKINILTVVDMDCEKNQRINHKNIDNFPICEDVKGIVFDSDRLIRKSKEINEFPIKSNESKLDNIATQSNFQKLSNNNSFTLNDILITTDNLQKNTSNIANYFLSKTSNYSPKVFSSSPTQSSYNQNYDMGTVSKINKDLSATNTDWNRENFKIYDYYESTTLLPIGQGIASLNSQKSGSQNFPIKSSFGNSCDELSSKSNKFYQYSPEINETSLANYNDNNSLLEIPPYMPPLLTLKRSGYSPIQSVKLPIRPKPFFETFHRTDHSRAFINKEDDYQDIENISFKIETQRPPSSYWNNIIEKGNQIKRFSSNENNNFDHLPTKLSSSYSSLNTPSPSMNHNKYPVVNNTKDNTNSNLLSHMSTAF